MSSPSYRGQHRFLPDGQCEHRWANRQRRTVTGCVVRAYVQGRSEAYGEMRAAGIRPIPCHCGAYVPDSYEGDDCGNCGDAAPATGAGAKALIPAIPDLPERVVVGANGAYWRDYGAHYSMCPVSTDNEPVDIAAIYVRDYLDPILDRVEMDSGWAGDKAEAPR